jgi:hypothetical protein
VLKNKILLASSQPWLLLAAVGQDEGGVIGIPAGNCDDAKVPVGKAVVKKTLI